VYTINTAVFGIVIMFQACSKNYDVQLQRVGLPPKCRDGQCKTSQINPDLDLIRPPTKVLFVVDNSRTMKLSQGYLAKGVKTLADDLHGFNADFYVYSTSDKHEKKTNFDGTKVDKDDKPVLSSTPLQSCQWTEDVDGKPIIKTGGACPKDKKITYSSEIFNLMNPSLATDLRFRSEYSAAQLNWASDQLSAAITSVGVDGSSTETGLCTLVRSVYNESANSLFKKGDNAAMVILSDENDFTSPQNCLSRVTEDETMTGQSAVTVACDPATENCGAVDYEVTFAQQKLPFATVSASYQCETEGAGCGVGAENCSKVNYSYQTLRSRVRYSCLNKVSYSISFSSKTAYSRAMDFSCFSKVPYTIQFNNAPTYARDLTYKCEQLEDGVPVAVSDLYTVADFKGNVDSCVAGSELVCDSASQTNAAGRCLAGSRILAGSCKLKCKVGSKPVDDLVFDDTDANAMGRNLITTTTGFTKDGVDYLNLADWASKKYPQYTVRSNGISRGNSDSGPGPGSGSTIAGLTSACTAGELVACSESQRSSAASACGTSKHLTPNSCNVRCVANTSTKPAVTYDDSTIDADLRDLRSTQFTDATDGLTYANLAAYALAKYPNETASVGLPTQVSTATKEPWMNENCSEENNTGVNCGIGTSDANFAANACSGKKVKVCQRKCVAEDPKTISLSDLTQDKVNFCTNADANIKFTAPNINKYSSIQAYAGAITTFSGAVVVKANSCARTAYSYSPVSQTSRTDSNSKVTCDGNYDSVFNWNTVCKGTNPKQNGVTPGSITYSCVDYTTDPTKYRDDTTRPQLVRKFDNYLPVNGEDICTQPFKVGAQTYENLIKYQQALTGRTDTPICKAVAGRKTVVPPGLVTLKKEKREWTFPRTIASDSPEANLEQAFLTKSTELFGDNGYFVSAIIRDSVEDAKETDCAPLGADQSLGLKYRSLVEASGARSSMAKGEVASICASDYSKSLSSVSRWIKENARRTVFFPDVGEGDEVLSVWLVNEATGEEKTLEPKIDYEIVGNKLNFINPAVDPKGWLIKYVYWEPKDQNGTDAPPEN
jgi:hypothetical protein